MSSIKFYCILLINFVFLSFIFLQPERTYAQVLGCTDPAANNFNSLANKNDGSCTYNTTTYTPVVKVDPMNALLNENSGLQMAGGFLWTFNDGGGAAAIYRIDTLTSAILQTVNLAGATNIDWEDIAFDGSDFYVGDFGNNANGARSDLKIYKFPLSAIPGYNTDPVFTVPAGQVEVINFTYADQPQPTVPTTANNTKFDCEAMIVDGGKIHLFSKNWVGNNSTHYVINSVNAGTFTATPLETLASNYLVTGADKTEGQEIIALLGYQVTGTANHFLYLLSDYSNGNYFNGNKRKINLPDAFVMGQGEGITFRNSSYGYISNEKLVRTVGSFTITINQKLQFFDVAAFIPISVLPVELKRFEGNNLNGLQKLSWEFESSENDVELQYSTDAIHFTVLKVFPSCTADFFIYSPTSSKNYYRLAWKNFDGRLTYSGIVSIKGNYQGAINHFAIKANGELTFILNDNLQSRYSFRLIDANGRLLSEIKSVNCVPGANKFNFPKSSGLNNVVFLSVFNNNDKITKRLHVEN